VSTVGVSWLD